METAKNIIKALAVLVLQWSHAQPNVETHLSIALLVFGNYASMEPRSAERGNLPYTLKINLAKARFNGATLSRTWKQKHEPLALCHIWRFNGATLSRTWKPARKVETDARRVGRFNGATLSRTWKRPM